MTKEKVLIPTNCCRQIVFLSKQGNLPQKNWTLWVIVIILIGVSGVASACTPTAQNVPTQAVIAPKTIKIETPTAVVKAITTSITHAAIKISKTPSPTQNVVYITVKSVNLRLFDGPHMHHPQLPTVYPRGTKLTVLAKYTDWLYVESPNGEKGWTKVAWITVDTSLLDNVPIISNVPTQPAQIVPKTKEAYPIP